MKNKNKKPINFKFLSFELYTPHRSCKNIFVLFIYSTTLATCEVSRLSTTHHSCIYSETDVQAIINQYMHQEESVYVYNLQKLRKLYSEWTVHMENVKPFYAVKCNPDKCVLQTLADLGCNFDCASPMEIEVVRSLGVNPNRILYANPCKKESDIRFAVSKGVMYTVFDCATELAKIARVAPEMKLILRIFAADPTAKCALSNKYGSYESEWEALFEQAKELGMQIIGVSFHVGSGAGDPSVYASAIELAGRCVSVATKYDFDLSLLDIGGGFTVQTLPSISEQVAAGLSKIPKTMQVIAEPGRYFAETVATLFTKIINTRKRVDNNNNSIDYWLTDGLYGSFNCCIYDHTELTPCPFPLRDSLAPKHHTVLWGPTCDGFDKIGFAMLPQLEYGDWLMWENAGAYTVAGACNFNGINFTQPICVYL